jgi:putative intracellular protease/amidase
MSGPYLVSFDTDRIKDYVFATDKLREIRGASTLLNRLNDPDYMKGVIKPICPDYKEVFFAGGSGAILAPTEEKAKEVIRAVEEAYRRETFTASITGACLPLAPALETKDFGQRMEVAGLRLREEKDRKGRRTAVMIEPYTQPCTACERFPATQVSPVDQQPVCDSCHAKREAARSKAGKSPEDLNQLGQLSRPPDYIGFVYADGNQMGELLSQMSALSDYRKLATGLDKLIRDSVDDSLKQHPWHGGAIQPYDQLLVGGDDLMLVTTGDFALEAALDIARRFEAGSPAVAGRLLTLGIGVVLAHASFPMAAFQRLASQLLKSAKRRCAELQYATSAIDFMVVTAAGSSDVSALREEALTEKAFVFPHGDRKVRLTQRPYALVDAVKLTNQVKAFRHSGFPRSQLQFLYEGLFHSQVEAVYRWGKVAGRVKKEHRELMEKFYSDFGHDTLGLPPWRRDIDVINNTDVFTSALGDLVEIYPFVSESAGDRP